MEIFARPAVREANADLADILARKEFRGVSARQRIGFARSVVLQIQLATWCK